jgi:uncharacterized membrane protein
LLFVINSKTVILIFKNYVMTKRSVYYLCLVLGILLILISEFQETKDLVIEIAGLCLLMVSLYQLSKRIEDRPTKDSYIENEEEE